MDVTGMLNNLADVYSLTTTQSVIGGVIEAYGSNPRLSAIKCRVRALTGRDAPTLGRDRENSTHRIYFDGGTVINDTDRITINSGNYRVTFPDDTDQQADLVTVDAERLI